MKKATYCATLCLSAVLVKTGPGNPRGHLDHGAPTETHGKTTKQYMCLFMPTGADNSRLDHAGTSGTRNAPFTAPTGVFTDAAMSVKTPPPYCRLGLGALKTPFFTDAATL